MARRRYACLTPWQKEPAAYGAAVLSGRYKECEADVVKMLKNLLEKRLERAIGVIYSPETELQSHYFYADLPRQFDKYIWFDRIRAVTPLSSETAQGLPKTFPFGV